jgi:hypothetical protein
MRPTEILVAFLIPIALASCSCIAHASTDDSDSQLEQRSAKQSSRDVKIPRALVTKLESEYRAYLVKNKLSVPDSIKRKLIDVSVELRQKRAAALVEEVRINTPMGGGVIDLADFVTPLRGAFQMHIKPRVDEKDGAFDLRVFFISQAKETVIDDEQFGVGCGKMIEVTAFFNDKMKGSGFELFTAGQRYLSVIGGVFVLVGFAEEMLQVGSVSFLDSRFPELFCE